MSVSSGQRGGERPSAGVIWRYVALQVPGWLLAGVILLWISAETDVATWVLWSLALAWVAKDIALFPLTWRAYAGRAAGESHDPKGRPGVALERLAPHGRIRVQGETWRAVVEPGSAPIEAGARVRVTGREGLELRVRPEERA
jgi:membrane-bound serine protease (ClpP class)